MDKKLQNLYDNLQNTPVCSNFELTIIHALYVLKRNNGNRTRTCNELKIAIRTLQNWIGIMKYWEIDIPNYIKPKKKPKKKN